MIDLFFAVFHVFTTEFDLLNGNTAIYNWNPNLGGSKVTDNMDGTYTVNYDSVVGSKEQRTYEDDDSFCLHYVGLAEFK